MTATAAINPGKNIYRLIDADDGTNWGAYPTARKAHDAAARLDVFEYVIWKNGHQMPGVHRGYCGDDDRARQGLGISNASEA